MCSRAQHRKLHICDWDHIVPWDKMTAIVQTIFWRAFFSNEKVCISFKISLKFVPSGSSGQQVGIGLRMAWRRTGDKPFIWHNDDLVYWCIYASLDVKELTGSVGDVSVYIISDSLHEWYCKDDGLMDAGMEMNLLPTKVNTTPKANSNNCHVSNGVYTCLATVALDDNYLRVYVSLNRAVIGIQQCYQHWSRWVLC